MAPRPVTFAIPAAAALTLALAAVPAAAADFGLGLRPAIAPALTWSGLYGGLFAGGAWGRAHATAPYDPVRGFFYNGLSDESPGGTPYGFNASGFFGGATLGYNWQNGAWVLGVEGEVGYLSLSGSRLDPNGLLHGWDDTTTSFESDFYGGLSARLGFAGGPMLFYAKGGLALLNAKASTIDPCVAPPAGCGDLTMTATGKRLMTGWSVGGGVEWALSPEWTVKAEYVYFDFGTIETSGPATDGFTYSQSVAATAHTAKLGINYRFGAGWR